MMHAVFVEQLVDRAGVRHGVRFESDASGLVTSVTVTGGAQPGDLVLGTAVAGFGNAHSHVFHRALRGHTHDEGGTFWTWRERMYQVAGRLTPDTYRELAAATYREMVASGWTAVAEFHYLHHHPDGSRYPGHEMELALVDAAKSAGIRLTLLDTCYLTGAIGAPLAPEQQRLGDGSAERWLERWHSLREALRGRRALVDEGGHVTLGAAVHSVRAVPPGELAHIARGYPANAPLHVHLSEQLAENAASLAAYGRTPTELLADEGLLTERLSVVHATHVSAADIRLLGDARVHAVICPTAEADLGDGIGPAVELTAAGARLAVGSDGHAVIDPLLELRALEAGERLRSLTRGRIRPTDLLAIGAAGGYAAIGLAEPLSIGGPLDLVELDVESVRTAGCDPTQLALAATAADVQRVVIGGHVAADRTHLAELGQALASAIAGIEPQ
ncbi:MAG TPA: formimidoylglutamate deiminase [Candidatus Lumbricidophila sp.]|nr:formimidoylglutamate deiminase [Candidatus Lumbricidophila sp.]